MQINKTRNILLTVLWVMWILYAFHYSVAYYNWYEEGAIWMFLIIIALPLFICTVYKNFRYFIYKNDNTKRWYISQKWFMHNNMNLKLLFRWIILADVLFACLMLIALLSDEGILLSAIRRIAHIAFYIIPLFNALPYLVEYWFWSRTKILFIIASFAAVLPFTHISDLPFVGKYTMRLSDMCIYAFIVIIFCNIINLFEIAKAFRKFQKRKTV